MPQMGLSMPQILNFYGINGPEMVKFTVSNSRKNWGNFILKCKKNLKKGKNVDIFPEKGDHPVCNWQEPNPCVAGA